MEQRNIVNMSFDEILLLLKSNNLSTDVRSKIYKSLDQIIRKNHKDKTRGEYSEGDFDEDEDEYEKEEKEHEIYEELVAFFGHLIDLNELDLVKKRI